MKIQANFYFRHNGGLKFFSLIAHEQ